MRTPGDLLAAAKRSGLRVVGIEHVPTSDGRSTIATLMEFDDPWAAARLLLDLAKEDASDPVVREWALAIQKACAEELGEQGPTRSPELIACTAAAIQENVQRQILFIHERKETFQSARETIAMGAGDCDDHARLVLALLLAANIPESDLVFFEEDDQPVHVVAVALGEWMETTIAADFGEHPYDALERLEVETGENPMSASPIQGVGFLGLDFVTASDVQTRKTELDAIVRAIDADVASCSTLATPKAAAWASFATSWRAFMAEEPSWYNSGGQGRQAQEYADEIRQWQQELGACAQSAPLVVAAKEEPTVGIVKTLAIAAGVVAAAVAVVEIAKTTRAVRA